MRITDDQTDAEQALERLFENALMLIWWLDRGGQLVRVSHSHAELLAVDPAAWRGDPSRLIHPEDRASFVAARAEAARVGSARVGARLRHSMRGWLGCEGRIVALRADSAAGDQLVLFHPPWHNDDELFRTVTQHVPATVYLCRNDATYSMMFINDEVHALTGWAVADFLSGRINIVALFHPDDAPMIEAEVGRALAAQRPFQLRYRLRHREGTWRHIIEHGQGIWNTQGELIMLAGTLADDTPRVEAEAARAALEQRLLQAQKLESLGLLAGGIAHDFNNLLVVILGNIDLALMDTAASTPAARRLQAASRAAEQASELTRHMLAYAGRSPTERGLFDLREVVDGLVELVQASHAEATLACEHVDGALPVNGDSAQLQQVVMNLLINAVEALDGGGQVRVRTARVALRVDDLAERVIPAEPLTPGAYALLSVHDEGCGMDAETLSRVFDPFFSTKASGHGLGLAAVIGSVHAHRGALSIDSTPGLGTTFRVYLPLADEASTPSGRDPAQACVLVVEDEPGVREVATLCLEAAGFQVVATANGHEALAALSQLSSRVAAIVLDVHMPDLDGPALLGRLQGAQRRLPVVLTSGNTSHVPPSAHGGPLRFLPKPYRTRQLVAVVREVLASPMSDDDSRPLSGDDPGI